MIFAKNLRNNPVILICTCHLSEGSALADIHVIFSAGFFLGRWSQGMLMFELERELYKFLYLNSPL